MNKIKLNRKFTMVGSKILILVQIFLLLFIIVAKADYQGFKDQLDTM
jgi:hypothetical protein